MQFKGQEAFYSEGFYIQFESLSHEFLLIICVYKKVIEPKIVAKL